MNFENNFERKYNYKFFWTFFHFIFKIGKDFGLNKNNKLIFLYFTFGTIFKNK